MPASRRKRATNSAIRRRSGERVIWVVPETIFAGVADGIDFDYVVNVVTLNLPRDAGEGNQIIGDYDDVVGVSGVG